MHKVHARSANATCAIFLVTQVDTRGQVVFDDGDQVGAVHALWAPDLCETVPQSWRQLQDEGKAIIPNFIIRLREFGVLQQKQLVMSH